ncbi:MAG: vitamin B12 dependent-methionine synthase activation domain-containing protein [Candidatus Neomarinimicrobiota bacterium]
MNFTIDDLLPQPSEVLRAQGVAKGARIQDSVYAVVENALTVFSSTARPACLMAECTVAEFDDIYQGQGKNAAESPLPNIFPRAENLAVFALTMGEDITSRIQQLFKADDFPVAAMLDTLASLAADRAVIITENSYLHELMESDPEGRDISVLSYSPGYCGWDISGQEKLFQFLHPEEIGIYLNESFLMKPLKSVTGLLVAGRKEVHLFQNSFPFCRDCRDPTCQERMKRITES